ncbi:MAG: hypothetical protein R6V10_09545 [bacterium]
MIGDKFKPVSAGGLLISFLFMGAALLAWSCGVKGPPLPPELPAPAPPEDIKVRVREGYIELVWKAEKASGPEEVPAAQWEVLRADVPTAGEGPAYEILDRLYQAAYVDRGVELNRKVYYSIRGISENGRRGPKSKPIKVLNLAPPPAAMYPRAKAGNHFVELSWTPPRGLPPGAGFNIYRARNPALFPWRPVNAEPVTGGRFVDGPLKNNQRYFYEVRTVAPAQGYPPVEGPTPSIVSAVPRDRHPPDPPRGFTAVWTEQGVRMRWMGNQEPDIAGYVVVRRRSGMGEFEELNIDPLKKTEYLDKTARRGVEYDYAVYAVDNTEPPNKSEYSDIQSVYAEP